MSELTDFLFVPESEDSISESRLLSHDTDVSQPSKTIRRPQSDSVSAFQRRRSSEMSWDSMDDESTVLWIALLRAGRANRIALPESGLEPQTSDGSGEISLESSEKAERLSSLVRTYRDSCETPTAVLRKEPTEKWTTTQTDLWGEWEPFCGIWPRWGLSLYGEVYELPKWEPRTEDREFSCWPTSRREDSESTGAHRGYADTLTSATEAWSTPRSQSAQSTGPSRIKNREDIQTQAEKWKSDLTKADYFWGTPTSRDWKDGACENSEVPVNRLLGREVVKWKTPHGLSFRPEAGDPGGGGEFAEQATNWGSSRPAQTLPIGLQFSIIITCFAPLFLYLSNALPSPYNKLESMFKRRLNPNFVDWMMGWLVDWSSEGRVFRAAEMESYLFKQRHALLSLLGESD